MKKITRTFLVISMVVIFLSLTLLAWYLSIISGRKINQYSFDNLFGQTNKVILFIGDGMGENHVKLTGEFYGRQMNMTQLGQSGYVTTFSNSLFSATDSAAAGSALATGKKFDTGEVSRHNGTDIRTISEECKSKGLGVGIITTDSLNGATPASFSSHSNSRRDTDDIIKGQINSDIDLLMGAGEDVYSSYSSRFIERGYDHINSLEKFDITKNKIIATFSSVVATNGTYDKPTLEMLTEYALNFLETKYPSGYFLMIEGAHIDKKSHAKDVFKMMEYLLSFDSSVAYAKQKLYTQNIAIIVTADHETGGLKFVKDKTKINNSLYEGKGHTSKDVPYYFYLNPKNSALSTKLPQKIDNTDVFKITKALLCAS